MGNTERCITISSSATAGTAASLVDDSAAAVGAGVGAGIGAGVGETVGAGFGVGSTGLFIVGFDERTVVFFLSIAA